MGTLLKTIALLLVVCLVLPIGYALAMPLRENHPVFVTPDIAAISPGQSTTVAVGLDSAPGSTVTLTMSYSGLTGPSTLTFPSGQQTVNFTVSVPSNFTGENATFTASGGGSSVTGNVPVL